MLVKGQIRGNTKWLANHLMRTDTNENVRMLSSNCGPDVYRCLRNMKIMHGSDFRNILHAKIAPEHGKELSDKDWRDIRDEYCKFYGLENHACVMVIHKKNAESHAHLVYSARDYNGKLFKDSHIFKRNLSCQTAICERLPHLGLVPAQRGRDSEGGRIGYSRKCDADHVRENNRGHAPGLSADEVALRVSNVWKSVQSLESPTMRAAKFQNGLLLAGFAIVNGDKGPGIVHKDDLTTFHPLGRRLGVKVAEARKMTAGLALLPFHDVKQAFKGNPEIIPQIIDGQKATARRKWDEASQREERRLRGEEAARQRKANDEAQAKAQRRAERRAMQDKRLKHMEISNLNGTFGSSHDFDKIRLHRHLKELGLEKSGVWKSLVDDSWRFRIAGTNETVAIYPTRITIHTRPAPSRSSDAAIEALIETAKTQNWIGIKLFGDEEFRKRAAIKADQHGLKLSDPDLQKYVDEQKAKKIKIPLLSDFVKAHGIRLDSTKPKPIPKIEKPLPEYAGPKFR